MTSGTPGGWSGSGHLVTSPQGPGMQGVWQESCLCARHREWEMFLLEGQDMCPGPVSERLSPLDETMALQAQQGAGCPLPSTPRLAQRNFQLPQSSGVPGAPLWASARRMTIQVKEIDFYLFLDTKENRCSA